jgi:hypothetical protein
LQLPCQGLGIGFVPGPLLPLHEALATALDLAWKVGRQRREASTKLNFGSLPRWQGSLRGLSRSYVFRCRIWMTRLRLILNLPESPVPGSMVLLETGNMLKEIHLQSVLPVFVFSYSLRSLLAPLAWVICHMNGSLWAFSQTEEGWVDVKGLRGGLSLAQHLVLVRCPPCRLPS